MKRKFNFPRKEPRLAPWLFSLSWEQREFQEIVIRASLIGKLDGLPRVEYEDIISGTGRLNKDIFSKESKKAGILFNAGDILYGKLRPYLKNWLLPNFQGIAVGDFWVLQPIETDSSFLYRLIQSRQFDEIANQSTGTKMPRADWKLVASSTFLVPTSIAEQGKIGTMLSKVDDLITLHQRGANSWGRVRFRRFCSATIFWEQREFQEIVIRASLIGKLDGLPRVEYEDIISGTGRLNKDIFSKESKKAGILFNAGDILYGKLRPYLKNWLLPNFQGIAVGDFWVLQPIETDSSFLYRLIQSRQFDEIANQSTGTKMPRADWKLVASSTFLVPTSIAEQGKIGTMLSKVDDLITLHQREFTHTNPNTNYVKYYQRNRPLLCVLRSMDKSV